MTASTVTVTDLAREIRVALKGAGFPSYCAGDVRGRSGWHVESKRSTAAVRNVGFGFEMSSRSALSEYARALRAAGFSAELMVTQRDGTYLWVGR